METKIHVSSIRYKHILISSVKAIIFIALLFIFFPYERVHFAALGSSCFAAFAIPQITTGRSKNLFFSYLTAVIIGILFSLLSQLDLIKSIPYPIATMTAVAVGLMIFIELRLDIEHAPSAGIAIGFLIDPWSWKTPIAIMTAMIILIVFRDFCNWAFKSRSKRVKKKI